MREHHKDDTYTLGNVDTVDALIYCYICHIGNPLLKRLKQLYNDCHNIVKRGYLICNIKFVIILHIFCVPYTLTGGGNGMRILMVNKYLWQKGGAETYVLKLGAQLSAMGNEVEYFGMADGRNTVGNSVGAYAAGIDFHSASLKYLTYPFRIIYSRRAAKKIRAVIESFKPDAVHLNNFNYQLTPSIIYEIKRHNIPIIYTAHDVQLVCPNHKLKNGDGGVPLQGA